MVTRFSGFKWWRHYPIYAPVLVLALCVIASFTNTARRFDYFLLDRMTVLRHISAGHADPLLYFVGIDDATLAQFGRWPLARVFHGDLLSLLSVMHPATVAWDILFTEEDAINDDAFIEGLQALKAPVVIAAARAEPASGKLAQDEDTGLTHPLAVEGRSLIRGSARALLPIERLRKVTLFGFADSDPELDGVRRRVPLVVKIGSNYFPSLALQAALQFWKVEPSQLRVALGDAVYIDSPHEHRRIPITDQGEFWINYRYEEQGFAQASYGSLYQALTKHDKGEHVANLPDLTGKLLVVALTATGSSEIGRSPLDHRSLLPLVHMNVLDNLLREDYLHIATRWQIWLAWLVVAYATVRLFEKKDFLKSVAILGLVIVATLVVMYLLFAKADLWLRLGVPLLGFVALHLGGTGIRVLQEQHGKREMRRAFSSYLAPAVLEQVMENPEQMKLGGQRKSVTILFSDIRGFTAWSEAVSEESLVAHLNEYFTEMVNCVNRHGGTLHKFIGDAIMAVWGDAISAGAENDARNALRAALEMQAALAQLNARWHAEERQQLKIGIGVEHGDVLVGNLGAPQRMEFTVIGDAVNVASRVEGLTKEWHTAITVGEKAKKLAGERFLFRTVGRFLLVGKKTALSVSMLLRERSAEESIPAMVLTYERAFADYLAGDFAKAVVGFKAFLQTDPQDYCAWYYANLCDRYIENPHSEPWDGVHRSVTK